MIHRIVHPNAKVNLGLKVVGRRADGYHDIETVFYPIPVEDTLEVEESNEMVFGQEGAPLDCSPEDNLVMSVLRSLQQDYVLPPLHVTLTKGIPSGAGLGGGSADAAFVMRVVNEVCGLGMSADEMCRRLSPLGADCPFFVHNRPILATGIGDVFAPVTVSLEGMTLVLVKPQVHVSTREAYAGMDALIEAGRLPGREVRLEEVVSLPVEAWRERLRNDFEVTVFEAHPEVAAIKARLYDMGAVYASMSGSGSAVFGLFRGPVGNAARLFAGCFVAERAIVPLAGN